MKNYHKLLNYYQKGGVRTVGRVILEYLLIKSKFSTKLSQNIYNNVAEKYYQKVLPHRGTKNYDCPLDPIKIIYVNPSNINKHTCREYPQWNDKRRDVASVVDNTWNICDDQSITPGYEQEYENIKKIYEFDKPFNKSIFYRSIYNHFAKGVDWNRTELIQTVLNLINKDVYVWQQCKTAKEVNIQCRYIDRLYNELKKNGYKTQYQIGACGDILECYIEEVCVDIGPDGDFYLVDGRHRLALAKILDLEEIPVSILARDKDWMETRESVWRKEESIDHPDVQPYFS